MRGLDARLVRRIHAGLSIDVTLAFGAEIAILFGPSGAGKSSVLRLIAGLDRPGAGHVRVGGTSLFESETGLNVPLRSRRIGLIFQDDLLFPHLSVAENLRFGLLGLARPEASRRVSEVAELCGVGSLLKRRPATLSGGERQRVGLARALAPRPRLLLCDEPVSAIDLDGRSAMVDRIRAVQKAEAIPVLYVTHSPAEAVAIGSRLFLLDRGTILAEGAPLEVLSTIGVRPGSHLDRLRNVFAGRIAADSNGSAGTRVGLEGGPTLIVPTDDRPAGSAVSVSIAADEILLAIGPCDGLSARNRLPATVDRVVRRGPDAEVVLRTGEVSWIASLTASSVAELGLERGKVVTIVVKARSCRLA